MGGSLINKLSTKGGGKICAVSNSRMRQINCNLRDTCPFSVTHAANTDSSLLYDTGQVLCKHSNGERASLANLLLVVKSLVDRLS